jgi:hypothetical protein
MLIVTKLSLQYFQFVLCTCLNFYFFIVFVTFDDLSSILDPMERVKQYTASKKTFKTTNNKYLICKL